MIVDGALLRKLGIRGGASVLLVNAPAGYAESLRVARSAGPVGAAEARNVEESPGSRPARPFDLVHLFCATRAELDALAPAALAGYRTGGHLWVSYPKGGAKAGTDLNRDVDWGPLAAAGFRAVTQVAIDERWSALRFRRLDEVGR